MMYKKTCCLMVDLRRPCADTHVAALSCPAPLKTVIVLQLGSRASPYLQVVVLSRALYFVDLYIIVLRLLKVWGSDLTRRYCVSGRAGAGGEVLAVLGTLFHRQRTLSSCCMHLQGPRARNLPHQVVHCSPTSAFLCQLMTDASCTGNIFVLLSSMLGHGFVEGLSLRTQKGAPVTTVFLSCSFSLLSENETQLHYFEVHTAEGRSHGHLGSFPVENTGSGVAIALKRPILTSKNGNRYMREMTQYGAPLHCLRGHAPATAPVVHPGMCDKELIRESFLI